MKQRHRKRMLAPRARVTYFADPVQPESNSRRILSTPRRIGVSYTHKWLRDLEEHAAMLQKRSHNRRPLRRSFPVPAKDVMPYPLVYNSNLATLGVPWSLSTPVEAT